MLHDSILTGISDVLKFEYLTQLLLDSNYLPLVLKLFAHQDVDKIIDNRTDRDDMRYGSNIQQIVSSNPSPVSSPFATAAATTPNPLWSSRPRQTKPQKAPTKPLPHQLKFAANYPWLAHQRTSVSLDPTHEKHLPQPSTKWATQFLPSPWSPSRISHGATSSRPSTSFASCRKFARTKPIEIYSSCSTNLRIF